MFWLFLKNQFLLQLYSKQTIANSFSCQNEDRVTPFPHGYPHVRHWRNCVFNLWRPYPIPIFFFYPTKSCDTYFYIRRPVFMRPNIYVLTLNMWGRASSIFFVLFVFPAFMLALDASFYNLNKFWETSLDAVPQRRLCQQRYWLLIENFVPCMFLTWTSSRLPSPRFPQNVLTTSVPLLLIHWSFRVNCRQTDGASCISTSDYTVLTRGIWSKTYGSIWFDWKDGPCNHESLLWDGRKWCFKGHKAPHAENGKRVSRSAVNIAYFFRTFPVSYGSFCLGLRLSTSQFFAEHWRTNRFSIACWGLIEKDSEMAFCDRFIFSQAIQVEITTKFP